MTRERPSSGTDSDTDIIYSSREDPLIVEQQYDKQFYINGSILENNLYSGVYMLTDRFYMTSAYWGTTDTYGVTSSSITLSPGLIGGLSYGGYPFYLSVSSPSVTTEFTIVASAENYGHFDPGNKYLGRRTGYVIFNTGIPQQTNRTFRFEVPVSVTSNESTTFSVQWRSVAGLGDLMLYNQYPCRLFPTLSPTSLNLSMYLTNISATFNNITLQQQIYSNSFSILGTVSQEG